MTLTFLRYFLRNSLWDGKKRKCFFPRPPTSNHTAPCWPHLEQVTFRFLCQVKQFGQESGQEVARVQLLSRIKAARPPFSPAVTAGLHSPIVRSPIQLFQQPALVLHHLYVAASQSSNQTRNSHSAFWTSGYWLLLEGSGEGSGEGFSAANGGGKRLVFASVR